MMTYLDDLQSQTARGDELAAAVEGLELERAALASEVELLRGAIAAQDDRDRAAAERAGALYSGCDTSGALAAEVERLNAELAHTIFAAEDANIRDYERWMAAMVAAASEVGIEVGNGESPLDLLVAEITTLRAQLEAAEAERDDANAEAATDQRHAMESGAENLSLRAQLEALQNALDDAQLLADERGEELARGAGEGWRAVSEAPLGEVVEGLHAIIEVDYHHDFRGSWWSVADGCWITAPLKWRTAPRKE